VLALAVLLLVSALGVFFWLLMGRLSDEQRVAGGGMQLRVPANWDVVDVSQNQGCQMPGVDCIAVLSAPEGFKLDVLRYDQAQEIPVAAVDEREWQAFRDYYPNAVLIERVEKQVGGLPAIERSFLQNNEFTEPVYLHQVYIVKGLSLYVISAGFPSAEMMAAQAPVLIRILESIRFTP